jgi:hypothetical protein
MHPVQLPPANDAVLPNCELLKLYVHRFHCPEHGSTAL